MAFGLDARKAVSVARQPILDDTGHVFGYELLYRAELDGENSGDSDDLAGARVLSDGILAVGLDALTCGLRAFVKLTHHLLMDGAGTLLPPETTVLELSSDIPVTDDVIDTCRRLHGEGYALALDDFTVGAPTEALLPWVKFVKVDVAKRPPAEWIATAKQLASSKVRLVAENVESPEAAAASRAAGYHLFQGFYFCKPTTFARTPLPARRLAYLTLLAALNREDLSLNEVEDLVKHDVSLSYRVLRSVNSAAFGLRQEVTSIRFALMLLGVVQIRKWASVWSLAGLSDGGMPEAVSVALVRARCCELLGEKVAGPDTGSYFLLGLCSLLDVILQRRMSDALADMPLPAEVRDALLGSANGARSILDAVIAYERGAWDDAQAAADLAGCSGAVLPAIYSEALRWARDLSQHAKAA